MVMDDLVVYYQSKLVEAYGPQSCVDERLTSEGRKRAAKLMGGSVEVYDWLLIACQESGLNVQHLPVDVNGQAVDLVQLVGRVYQSEIAQDIGLQPGVDNDDHNEMVEDGCGYQLKRGQLLKELFGVEVGENQNMVNPFLLGLRAHLETYVGADLTNATLVENHRIKTTIDTEAVFNEGRPTVCHDVWLAEVFQPVIVRELESLGGDYVRVVQMVGQPGYLKDRSQKMFRASSASLMGQSQVVDIF